MKVMKFCLYFKQQSKQPPKKDEKSVFGHFNYFSANIFESLISLILYMLRCFVTKMPSKFRNSSYFLSCKQKTENQEGVSVKHSFTIYLSYQHKNFIIHYLFERYQVRSSWDISVKLSLGRAGSIFLSGFELVCT